MPHGRSPDRGLCLPMRLTDNGISDGAAMAGDTMAWQVVRNPVGVVAALLLSSFFGVVFAQGPAPDPKAAANAAKAQQDRIRTLEDQVRTQQERIRTLDERTRTAVADAEAERKRADAIVQFASRRIAE